MAKGIKTGGRKKGSLNRNTRAVLERLQEDHPNYCPLSELARIATDADTPIELKIKCNTTIASYVIPKISPISALMFDKRNGIEDTTTDSFFDSLPTFDI